MDINSSERWSTKEAASTASTGCRVRSGKNDENEDHNLADFRQVFPSLWICYQSASQQDLVSQTVLTITGFSSRRR
jgi:hypothetical protein